MILREEQEMSAAAARALQALEEAGIARETAAHLAVAAGAAAATNSWPPAELDFRLARALHQLGHADASRALLARALPRNENSDNIFSVPPELFPLFRAGALRSAGENAWRLDAAALEKPDAPLELSYARLIELFAARLLPLWENSQGRGELALAGWREHARNFSPARRAAAHRCRAWRRDLAEALNRRALNRGWPASPRVILAEPI